MLTNKLNLPQAVVLAVQNDPYTRGNSDISVTQLITPPYQRRLKETVEPVEDVAERLFSLYGQIGHAILERAGLRAGLNVEERLFAKIGGLTVSGQYDIIQDGCLQDYKFTTHWSVKDEEPKQEWVEQLNLLRVLAIRNGMKVTSLRIIAFLRDHQKTMAKRDISYPQLPVATVDIPLWRIEDAEEFMAERIKAHLELNPPPCSDAERWMTNPVYALKKAGRKSAIKLFDEKSDADIACEAGGKDHFVEYRKGEYRRCNDYCNVSHGCPIFQDEQRTEF